MNTGNDVEQGIRRLLELRGPYLDREVQDRTPARVVKAFLEMTEGYDVTPEDVFARQFESPSDDMVVLSGIRFTSLCEHHLMPFVGTATVAYIPAQAGPSTYSVVGLSKLARLVEGYARRLQLQERLTNQIASAMLHYPRGGLECPGAACIITAHHACMGCRGIRQPDARMTTSSMLGIFREPEVRSELLALHRGGG